jgi:prepilin-type N-terminal cleavage/methylation domain-containing protein
MTSFICTQCGRLFRISAVYAGKKIICISCGAVNHVPLLHENKPCVDSLNPIDIVEIPHHEKSKQSVEIKKGFTLIELLVVIAIIALLLSVLIPGLKKAKDHARKVICKSNLHQWSILFQMYLNDNNSKFMPEVEEDFATGKYSWVVALMPYHNTPEIRFCPVADRTASEGGVCPREAWDITPNVNPNSLSMLHDSLYKVGSYGVNWWVASKTTEGRSGYDEKLKWGKIERGSASIPVLMDCNFPLARPLAGNQPMAEDRLYKFEEIAGNEMARVCTNRHNFEVQILYMDWSSSAVGLKSLWKQEWHRNYIPPAVEPEWSRSPWMRDAKGWKD